MKPYHKPVCDWFMLIFLMHNYYRKAGTISRLSPKPKYRVVWVSVFPSNSRYFAYLEICLHIELKSIFNIAHCPFILISHRSGMTIIKLLCGLKKIVLSNNLLFLGPHPIQRLPPFLPFFERIPMC